MSKEEKNVNVPELMDNFPTRESLEKCRAPQKVDAIVSYILEREGKTNDENTMSSTEILEMYDLLCSTYPDVVIEIPHNTLLTTLSYLAHAPWSRINCQGRKQGYYVSILTSTPQPGVQIDSKQNKIDYKKRKDIEKTLYPIVTSWLSSKVDRVKDISAGRKNSKWHNPDIFGVDFKNVLGQDIAELYTVEVKPSMDSWQEDIFEAVSHSMFVHYSYFAFLHSNESKIPDEMKVCAHRFNIGLLSIEMSEKDYDEFREKGVLTENSYEIIEVLPAPYSEPDRDEEISFLESFDIKTLTDLHDFGLSAMELSVG